MPSVSGGRLHSDADGDLVVPASRPKVPGILHRDGPYVTLTDMPTAGYLYLELPIVDAKEVWETQRKKIYEFSFYDPTGTRAEALALEFVNDRCADYDDRLGRLRKMLNKFHGRSRYNNNGNGRNGGANAGSRKR